MFIKLLISYQVLIINLSLTHILAKKKYTNWVTFTVLVLFTLVEGVILYLLTPLFSSTEPTVWFVLAGVFYLIPLNLLYKLNFKKIVTIMIYCWTYTMIISSIAVGLSNFINLIDNLLEILFIQTLLLLITLRYMISFTKNKFFFVINNATDKTISLLLLLGASLFATITGIRYFINPEESIYFSLVFFLIIIIITSYNLLFNNVQSNINLDSVKKVVNYDNLTGIANRHALVKDMKELISRKNVFILLFLDVDNLKRVNDTHGHNTGDKYLKQFANTLIEQTQNYGKPYRFAGDEFVCLISDNIDSFDITEFKSNIYKKMTMKFQFNGVSLGMSTYPDNGDDPDKLIQVADRKMYEDKNSKKN